MKNENRHIVIFDGVCNFCNSSVNFIIDHDPKGLFAFTPLQSEMSKGLIKKHKISDAGHDTFLLIKNGACFVRTDAALEITKDLSGYWYLFAALKIVPRPLRDYFYRLLARNRYAIFGRTERCMVPSKEVRHRFIG